MFIALGASFAYEYTRMAQEVGLEVVHTVAYHYDPRLDDVDGQTVAAATDVKELAEDISTSINDGQQTETLLTLKNSEKPDFVITRVHETGPWAMKMGIPVVTEPIALSRVGYRALVEFGERIIKELQNTNFVKRLGEHYVSPYSEAYQNLQSMNFLEE